VAANNRLSLHDCALQLQSWVSPRTAHIYAMG